jgi:hypothetical protein
MSKIPTKEEIEFGYEVFFQRWDAYEDVPYEKEIPDGWKLFYDEEPIEARKMAYVWLKYLFTISKAKDNGYGEIAFTGKLVEELDFWDECDGYLYWWDFDDLGSSIKNIDSWPAENREKRRETIKRHLKALQREYLIYKEHGFDMGGPPVTLYDCEGNPYTVLNMELTLRC